jgi:hypothetical protein
MGFTLVEAFILSIYRLCYVDNNILYFTDDFKHAYGDDFDDAPYEHNAGTPYQYNEEWTLEENKEHGHTHLRIFAYEHNWLIKKPCDNYGYNSPYSVEDINNGAIAWLFCEDAGGLMAGATIKEAKEWFKKANTRFGELKL